MKHVLLAHGILGFGAPTALPTLVNYFNGVAAHFRAQGQDAIAPQVNPIGSIAQRGAHLGAIIASAPLPPGEKLHIIAHSMGGLDSRYALAHVAGVKDRVGTLITIGTPHLGSAVADAIVARSSAIFAHCPALLIEPLRTNTAGLHDLTTAAVEQFNATTPDVPGVRYFAVAGDASHGGHESLLLQLAAVIGHEQQEVNDGVVTRRSALRDGYEPLADWPVDHFGEIGWTFPLLPIDLFGSMTQGARAHLARYDALMALL
jgi:triacylglycerol lipase